MCDSTIAHELFHKCLNSKYNADNNAKLMWRNENSTPEVPLPELYYDVTEEEEEIKRYIWPSNSTLPRDVLIQSSSDKLWMYVIVRKSLVLEYLPGFIEHYVGLGFERDGMIFSIGLCGNQSGHSKTRFNKNIIQQVMRRAGADYRVWIGTDCSVDEAYRLLLFDLQQVPLRDWIFVVEYDQYLELKNQTVQTFLEECEKNGANYVYGKTMLENEQVQKGETTETGTTQKGTAEPQVENEVRQRKKSVVAFRGYLRPDAQFQRVFDIEDAEDYFALYDRSAKMGSLYALTPYWHWWVYYASKISVGNAYLWYGRANDGIVEIRKFSSSFPHLSVRDTNPKAFVMPVRDECSVVAILSIKALLVTQSQKEKPNE